MVSETSEGILTVADSLVKNGSLIYTDKQDFQNDVLSNLQSQGFTIDETTTISEIMNQNSVE